MFWNAQKRGKDVEAHLDQCNVPTEKETEMFCDFVETYKYQGKARAVHSISLSCHPIEYQKKIAKQLKKLDVGVIVCPSAALSMTQQSTYMTPIHNSIAPVSLLVSEGVKVGLGVDNVEDIFMPFSDGNLMIEMRMLSESVRMYDEIDLLKIAENRMGFD